MTGGNALAWPPPRQPECGLCLIKALVDRGARQRLLKLGLGLASNWLRSCAGAITDQPQVCRRARLPAGVAHQLLNEALEGELLPLADRLPVGNGQHRRLGAGCAHVAAVVQGGLPHEQVQVGRVVDRIADRLPPTHREGGHSFRLAPAPPDRGCCRPAVAPGPVRHRDGHTRKVRLGRAVVWVLAEDAGQTRRADAWQGGTFLALQVVGGSGLSRLDLGAQ